jgi:HSP20 family protein
VISLRDCNLHHFAHDDFIDCDDHYEVVCDLPGIPRDDIKIECNDNLIVVSGSRRTAERENAMYVTRHRFSGDFSKTLAILPKDADADNITASHNDGVLSLVIPKIVKPVRTIKISV